MSNVSDQRLVEILNRVSPPDIGWQAGLPTVDIHAIVLELQSLRAENERLGSEPHADDLAVDRFAAVMKAKLAKKRNEGRGGWELKHECSAEFLSELLRFHVEKGDPVDVANFCMMLQQRGEMITK